MRALAAEETLTLYNGQHRQTTEAIVEAFGRASGIKVTIRQGESSQLAAQIVEEGANSPADVFYSEQSPPIASLDEKRLLAPTDPATLRQIPPDYSSRNGTWVGATLRTRVIAYNKAMLTSSDLPPSIIDIVTPTWKNKIAYVIRDGFQEQIMAIVKLKGREAALAWLKALKQNGKLYNGNSAAMQAVERGEIAAALTNNYYWYAMAKESGAANLKSTLHYVAKGDAGALVNLSPAAVLKTSKKQEAAQRFLAFLVSEEGQRILIAPFAEYPVRAGIRSSFDLKPLDEIGAIVSQADIGSAELAYALQREAGML